MVACEAKDGKRQRHPVSVAARISSTADHDTPPRLCARYAMLLQTPTDAELHHRRDRVLTDEEAAAIWRAACEAPLPYGAIVRLLMLTGQRREEVAGMTWAELSEDLALGRYRPCEPRTGLRISYP